MPVGLVVLGVLRVVYSRLLCDMGLVQTMDLHKTTSVEFPLGVKIDTSSLGTFRTGPKFWESVQGLALGLLFLR